MAQLCLYNPHVDDQLAEPPHYKILKRRALKKYGHILSGLLKESSRVPVYLDATTSVFIASAIFQLLPKFIRIPIAAIEFHMWKRRNDLGDKVYRIKKPDPTMILLAFSYKAAVGLMDERLTAISQFKRCIFHLSHYFLATGIKSANLKRVPNLILAGDSDVSEHPYFKHYFSWYKKPLMLVPFAVAERFHVRKAFNERSDKIVAMGTFHNYKEERPAWVYKDYMDFFQTTTLHPARKLIFDHLQNLPMIESRISPYRPPKKGFIKQLLNRLNVSQAKYFSIDIVDLYNQHKFAVIGEEASGFPALGAFEALACGCVYIGQPDYYRGLGLEAGLHYAPYNGSLEDLEKQKKFLDDHPDQALKISSAGASFVARFRAEPAFKAFMEKVNSLS
jgi:hypothetical protein